MRCRPYFLRHRPGCFAVDPLSDVLSLLRPSNYVAGGFDAGGAWSIQFHAYEGVKCYAVASGECWVALDGVPPVQLSAGDCFLLPRGRPFVMANDLTLSPVDVLTQVSTPLRGGVRVINGGGSFFGVGAVFNFEGRHADILLGALPPIVHLRKESDKAALRWSIGDITESMPRRHTPRKMKGATEEGRSMPAARPQAAIAPP